MTNPPSSKDLISSSARAFKFEALGDVAEGTVISTAVRQITNMKTGEPEFFKSGDPKWQIVATLQTNLREDPDDDGVRSLYIKSFMMNAVKQAVAAAKADDLERGGHLTVVHTELGEAERGMSAPKFFTATYLRPSAQLLAEAAPQAPAPQAAPQYAQQVPAQATPQYAQQAAPAPAPAPYDPTPAAWQAPAPAPAPAPATASPVAAPSQEQLAAVIRANLDPQDVFKDYYQSLR
jgi:hypothetical protein